MEKADGVHYSTPIPNTEEPGYSPLYRAAGFETTVVDNFKTPINNLWELYEMAMKKCAKNAFLGTRVKYEDGTFGPYVWKTYQQIKDLTLQIMSGIVHFEMCAKDEFLDCDYQKIFQFLGIYSKNREEWNVTDYASAALGLALVPLYDTLGTPALNLILNKTRLNTIFASGECVEKLLKLSDKFEYLKFVVSFDNSEKHKKMAEEKNIIYLTWDELRQAGIDNPVDLTQLEQPTLQTVNTISFTSGTTGEPKGAIITHQNFISSLASFEIGILSEHGAHLQESDISLSYLPMAHIYERIVEIAFACKGAKIGFYCGDVLKILDDLDELCPTIFVSVPRLFFRMNDKIISNVKTKSAISQKLFNFGLNSKIHKIEKGGSFKHWLYDAIVFNKTNKLLGGNVRMMISGGAPLSAEMQLKMSAIFCVPLSQGYGLTETMGGSFLAHKNDKNLGHVGGPNCALEFKLKSVPEMNYNVTDNPPTGELLVKGPSISPGYFLNEEATKEMHKDGWFYTGDIVKIIDHGAIQVIDRSKNIFKLSQGEYVVPEKIEDKIAQLPFVEQVYLTGNSLEQYCVAIIHPNSEATEKWAKKQNLNKSFDELCETSALNKAILNEIIITCKENGLAGFEIPKAIYLSKIAFAIENDLLTPSFKIKRTNCKQFFKKEIEELYQQIKKL